MKASPVIAFIVLGLGGCNEASRPPASATNNQQNALVKEQGAVRVADEDNTAVNVRDRDGNTKTPIDQNENQADIDITANIRKQVVATKMSVNGQNVKIITQDGRVTLRGPVESDDEKQKIEDIARTVAGADKVDSQLDVEVQ